MKGRLTLRSSHPRAAAMAALLFAAALLGAAVLPASAEDAVPTRTDAVARVTDELLGGSLTGLRLYVDPEPLAAGTTVSDWHRELYRAPAAGWLVFVDPHPAANWEHDCYYVFVDRATGAMERIAAMTPPAQQARLVEITNGRDNPPPGMSEAMHTWLRERLAGLPKPPARERGQAYAFILSGGANQGNNHIRYWNDCAFIYTTLTEYYEYPDENIYVCISDGTNPAVDRSDGTNSPPDLDGDGDDDIQYPATYSYVQQVFNELATVLTPSDQLFIFTTDHGSQVSGYDCYLNLWNFEELHDDQLAAFVDALPCETVICCFEQCFSGGMVDDLEGDGRVIATAANWDEYSWAMPPNYIYDEFVYYWTSAVAWQEPDGTPVDADTNDDGLVSMHEAFLYAETHDTADETPQYSSTPPDLGDILNLFGNLQGVYLAMETMTVDDDDSGASSGDGDGVIEMMETIELTVELLNMGQSDATGVMGTLTSTNPYVTIHEDERGFGGIPAGATAANGLPFVFSVSHDVPNAEALDLRLELSEEPGTMALELTAFAPILSVSIVDIDDSAGNGDGIANPGENVSLALHIANSGGADSPALDALLSTGDANFTPDGLGHTLGVVPIGGGLTETGFGVEIDPACPEFYSGLLVLGLTGPAPYGLDLPFALVVGRIFDDDMEAGDALWSHYAGPGGTWTDQWHLETYRNHTGGGSYSWKCGGTGAGDYGSLLYACLATEAFTLPAGSQLTFWHWIDAETSSSYPDYCYDGGLLEITTDGGATWETLTPEGGYPYLMRAGGTPGPFPAETPVWSGTHGWQEVTVDLAGYEGEAQLRWAFGSDGAVTAEGWYVDDIVILRNTASAVEGGAEIIARPTLLPASPNPVLLAARPAGEAVQIRFALPEAATADLQLFDASGRLVRHYGGERFGAGVQAITWDGRDASGQRVAAGSYFYRLAVGSQVLSGRLAVMR